MKWRSDLADGGQMWQGMIMDKSENDLAVRSGRWRSDLEGDGMDKSGIDLGVRSNKEQQRIGRG